ncbi:hypothetical protein DI09_206p30 [Mitosporidium daphniae]|uniref:Uncharacterized protein n=1 Tax=Mitosporidium daphniae TaxID=1485682 RepID=A0A098VSR0_9MICR|nr:hypothetical protein DI09_206p30 [Mitosporidium daphniae]
MVPNHQGRASKGNQVNIPEPDFGMVAATLESLETLAVGGRFGRADSSSWSGAPLTARENPRASRPALRGVSSSKLVVLITAAGLQGEKPLVDRTM